MTDARILITDDEPMFLDTTAELLTYRGYRCERAHDATEAFEHLEHTAFDLLISDIRMPGNDDLALIREIQQRFPRLLVILVTGNPSVETAVESFDLPVEAYLLKPIDFEELLEKVEACLSKRSFVRHVEMAKEEISNWHTSLAAANRVLEEVPNADSASALEAYLTVGLKTSADSLASFARIAGDVSRGLSRDRQWQALATTQLEVSHQALVETVGVLERTKSLFKSKQLAKLRQKLEFVLESWPVALRGDKEDSDMAT